MEIQRRVAADSGGGAAVAGAGDHGCEGGPRARRDDVAGAGGEDAAIYAAQVLATVVGDSTGSRLFYALVDPAIVDEASMGYDPLDGAGGFITFLSADSERAAEAVRIAKAEFPKFAQEGPTEERPRGEEQNRLRLHAQGRAADGPADIWSGLIGSYRRNTCRWQSRSTRIFAVTGEQILELARKYDLANPAVVALGPLQQIQ